MAKQSQQPALQVSTSNKKTSVNITFIFFNFSYSVLAFRIPPFSGFVVLPKQKYFYNQFNQLLPAKVKKISIQQKNIRFFIKKSNRSK